MLDGCVYWWINDFWSRQLATNGPETNSKIPTTEQNSVVNF